MTFSLNNCHNILIIGAGHGIGLGLVQYLLENYPQANLVASYRQKKNATQLLELASKFSTKLKVENLDPTREDLIKELSQKLTNQSLEFDIIINCVGLLHTNSISPEKSLREFDPKTFLEVMRVNTIVTPLIAKYFEKSLRKNQTSIFATISAKVGSIEDNRIGGWYSYRASKAALNMIIKNISIEFKRKKKDCVVLAIHPGTTKTQLSEPFIEKTPYILHEAYETAHNILSLIDNRDTNDSGKFISWDKKNIPW